MHSDESVASADPDFRAKLSCAQGATLLLLILIPARDRRLEKVWLL